MRIYPAIDIKDGQCVRLAQGDFNRKTVYGNNPVEKAFEIARTGAMFLHVVDLDGALGNHTNKIVISEILSNTSLSVELGGGIRDEVTAENWLKTGVNRIVIGSKAIENLDFVKNLIKKHGADRIVVGVDAKDGFVSINGWTNTTNIKAIDFCKELVKIGVKHIVYTDIACDGMMMGPNFKCATKIIKDTKLNVTISGGISSIDDIKKCDKMGAFGVIIGKAFYTGKIDLAEVMKIFGA